jgi:GGDEF domain-containing protein
MDQIRKIDIFIQEASLRLPGVLYSFNIADLKRRNGHLGHLTGDEDIQDLDEMLVRLAPPSALVARTHGDRWHMLTAREETAKIQAILDAYARDEAFSAGWEMRGLKDGVRKTLRKTVATTMRRAVRCLSVKADTPDALKAAIGEIGAKDYSLPVNRVLALSGIAAMTRESWRCVAKYPSAPVCPFCGGADMDWTDGDDSVYSGDGVCEGCGAEVSLADISRLGA